MSKRSKEFFLYIFFALVSVQVSAQKEVDSLKVLVSQSQGVKKIDHQITLAKLLLTIDRQAAQKLANESLTEARDQDYSRGIVDASLIKATLLSIEGDHVESSALIFQVFELSNDIEYNSGLINGFLVKGNDALRKDEFDIAINSFLEGLELARKENDRKNEASFLMNIGRIKELLNQLEEAGKFLLEAEAIFAQEDDIQKQAGVNINLAVLEYKKQNLGLSIEYNQKALALSQSIGDKYTTALCYQNIGFAYGIRKDYTKAFELYDKSLKIRFEIEDQYGIGKIYLNKAKLYDAQGKRSQRQTYATRAIKMANKLESRILARDVYTFLYQTEKKENNASGALSHYERIVQIKDSLSIEANQRRIDELTARYNLDQLANANELKEKQSQIKTLQIERRNIIILGLVVLFIMLLTVLIVQRKKMQHKLLLSQKDQALIDKENELINLELESRKNQLMSYAQQLELKDSVIEETRAQLANLKKGSILEVQQVSEFLEKLNESLNQKDWPKFKLYFEATYPGFFEKLLEKCSDVTSNDQRLAAMIKISLTNKEMGSVFNISPDSVVRAKHRLKSKLGYDSPKQMEEFIAKL